MSYIQRMKEIKTLVDELSAYELADLYFEKGYGRKYLCPWPGHMDKHTGNFIVNKNKTFHCFACSAGHFNIFTYLKEVYGLDKEYAYLDIALRAEIIKEPEYLLLSKNMNKEMVGSLTKTYAYKNTFKKVEPLSDEILNDIYSVFCNINVLANKPKLTESHYQHLKNERNLSDDEIVEYGYFTFPHVNSTRKLLFQILKEKGYSDEILLRVPGFTYSKVYERLTFVNNNYKGIGIPMKNEKGLIVGIHIRKDTLKNKKDSRYVWFSSGNIDETKFSGGMSSGSPINVIYPNIKAPTVIAITEGHFKAIKIAKNLNAISISVQGINNWKEIPIAIKYIKEKYQTIKDIIIMYDADMAYKINVLDSTFSLSLGILDINLKEEIVKPLRDFLRMKDNEDTKSYIVPQNKDILKDVETIITEIRKSYVFDSFNIFLAIWDFNKGKGYDDYVDSDPNNEIKLLPLCDFLHSLGFMFEGYTNKNFITKPEMANLYIEYILVGREDEPIQIETLFEKESLFSQFRPNYNLGGDIFVPF